MRSAHTVIPLAPNQRQPATEALCQAFRDDVMYSTIWPQVTHPTGTCGHLVAPAHQGRGIGGALLQPVLAQADRNRMRCYLETQHERNVAFYEKRGFQVQAQGRIPGPELELWIMTRDPR